MKRSEFIKLKETISKMSRKEAIDHIWTYYKGSIIFTLVIIAVILILIF